MAAKRVAPVVAPGVSEGRSGACAGVSGALPVTGDGRDPRLDPAPGLSREGRERFALALAGGASWSVAAERVGVRVSEVRKALDADVWFAGLVADAERAKWDLAEEGLREALEARAPWAIRLVLKESEALRERWRPAPERLDVGVGIEVGPGVMAVAELAARLEERRALVSGSGLGGVLDVESSEVAP